MILKVFTKNGCPKCPAAKGLVKKLRLKSYELKIEEYNISRFEGLAEASFYSAMATPSLVLCDEQGREIFSWRGEVPSEKELLSKLKSKK